MKQVVVEPFITRRTQRKGFASSARENFNLNNDFAMTWHVYQPVKFRFY